MRTFAKGALALPIILLSTSAYAQAPAAPAPAAPAAPAAQPAAPAAAAPAAQPAAPAAAAPAAPKGDAAEARRRYEVGLKLYDENNWEAARIEFERAYAISPTYRILYNIGLVYRQLNNYTASLTAFERYLAEGQDIPAERKAEVEKEISELSSRIGKVPITTTVVGAEILVDDLAAGTAPLKGPLRVNPGIRKFTAQAKGHLPASKTLAISTGDNPELKLELVELPKQVQSNPWVVPTIIGLSATGLALAGTVITGVLGLNAQSDQEALLKKNGVTKQELDSARDDTVTMSGVNNAFLVGTIVFAGLSTFSFIKMNSWEPSKEEESAPPAPGAPARARRTEPSRSIAVGPAGLGIGAVGTF